ncbi:DNA translocase FtsK [Clostridium sp. SHJSY1]|uniref:FtsK/SpoIIIE family DNA translocase n=1 Tax=Clostridium sp. SHJSY1 TaxID=2942483 RepID=UPI002875D2CD|nr:DNA translocase FtsK [Clostridium sp. SHJSY1]MDS0524876.1 DNA translocase FtsK [Clostridium sp. SHJSY1]
MSRQTNRRSSKKPRKDSKESSVMEIKGIIFIAIGLLASIAMYTNGAGFLSNFAQRVCYLLIGVGSYVLPIYFMYLGYIYIKEHGNITLGKRFYGVTLFIIVVILMCSTIYIQAVKNPNNFAENFIALFNLVAERKKELNGGIFGYVITFPVFKLIGAVGSYIIYAALVVIGSILTFDFSLLKVGQVAKNKSREYKFQKRPKRQESKKESSNDDYIKIKTKSNDEEEKTKTDFLKDVNHKIKILDFMKNSPIDEELETAFEKESDISLNSFTEKSPITEKSNKKDKLDNQIKDVISKEIDETISGTNDKKETKEYVFPDIDLLNPNGKTKLNSSDKKELIESANKLEETLGNFGVEAKVLQVTKGPSVTRFELQPSPGVKVSKIVNLADDIALGLAASGVRIEAPIPGKAAVGIEVPNKKQTPVFIREVLDTDEFKNSDKKLAFALGKDIGGACVIGDLSKMPHTLIAGATGSGKSVCINTLIISLLYKYSPDEVKLLLVDPKVVELNVYNGIPHLLIPVVTEPKKAAAALNWAVNEMTKRYNLFAEKGVRNIDSYNALYEKGGIEEKLSYIVIIVDELADLMMVCANDVEDYIGRLAQMARAAGMHLVIATQRPSVDVITGVIKSNIPSRISFSVSSQVDSRTILDSSGAEKLLGKGDMLYAPVGENKPQRVQGCFISEEEVEKVIEFIKQDEKEIIYEESILDHINNEAEGTSTSEGGEDVDELLSEAIKLVVSYEQASTSFLQRRLRIGFNRASRIMDQLEEREVISPKDGSRPRQVLISKGDLMNSSENEKEN